MSFPLVFLFFLLNLAILPEPLFYYRHGCVTFPSCSFSTRRLLTPPLQSIYENSQSEVRVHFSASDPLGNFFFEPYLRHFARKCEYNFLGFPFQSSGSATSPNPPPLRSNYVRQEKEFLFRSFGLLLSILVKRFI